MFFLFCESVYICKEKLKIVPTFGNKKGGGLCVRQMVIQNIE
jgi:hypothetical protein